MRVIDDAGKMVGIMPIAGAIALATEQGVDLIEIAPQARPPVVKLQSYDKFRYQQERALRMQKKNQKKIEVKGIRLSVRIGPHDLKFKADQAEKFLSKGNKVKIDLWLRGREKANMEFAYGVLKKFLASITAEFSVEQEAKRLGGTISTVIGPK